MGDLVGVFPMIFAQDLLLGGDGDHGSCVLVLQGAASGENKKQRLGYISRHTQRDIQYTYTYIYI